MMSVLYAAYAFSAIANYQENTMLAYRHFLFVGIVLLSHFLPMKAYAQSMSDNELVSSDVWSANTLWRFSRR